MAKSLGVRRLQEGGREGRGRKRLINMTLSISLAVEATSGGSSLLHSRICGSSCVSQILQYEYNHASLPCISVLMHYTALPLCSCPYPRTAIQSC